MQPMFTRWRSAAAATGVALTLAAALALPAAAQEPSAPDANNDTATTLEDTAVVINVLANDTDEDDLDVTAVGPADHGIAVLTAGNTVTYTPDDDFNGTDDFTYSITNGSLAATATVTVTATAVNDAPVAANDTATTTKNHAVVINVLANDVDVDTNASALVVAAGAAPANGTIAVGADRRITYTPRADFVGGDSFTYVVSDGALVDTGTVTITVQNTTPPPSSDFDARVVAACNTYTGTDQGILALCDLYLSGTLPPWAEHTIGKVILFRVPQPPKPDRVAEACVGVTTNPLTGLCAIYLDSATPDWLKKQVGRLILKIDAGDVRGIEDRDDDRVKDQEKGKRPDWTFGNRARFAVDDDHDDKRGQVWDRARFGFDDDGWKHRQDDSDRRQQDDDRDDRDKEGRQSIENRQSNDDDDRDDHKERKDRRGDRDDHRKGKRGR